MLGFISLKNNEEGLQYTTILFLEFKRSRFDGLHTYLICTDSAVLKPIHLDMSLCVIMLKATRLGKG